ncbi:MAG: cbb3-type cytochrome oxidase assembly protein CcoS [Pseudomonadales bacterium]
MASLYLLIPVAIIFVVIAAALFLWAVRNRQFDDLDREGQRILFDSDASQNKDTGANAAAGCNANAKVKTDAGANDSSNQ